VDDAERARLVVEEAVERPGDRHVQIEKQRRPLQAAKTVPQDRQLDQDVGPAALDAGVARERNDFDTRIQSAGVFGAAEKPERPAQVAADAAIEPVDVVRAVAGAPFQAEDVYVLHGLNLDPSRGVKYAGSNYRHGNQGGFQAVFSSYWILLAGFQ